MAKHTVYILEESPHLVLSSQKSHYDPVRQINMVTIDSIECPIALVDRYPPTQSKTMAAPGDDDPDDERCY